MKMGPRQAEAVVTAFLGRPPQDELEAAVVLESWGGVRSGHALATAAQMHYPQAGPADRRRRGGLEPDTDSVATIAETLGTLAFLVALLVLAAIASTLGASDAVDAWRPAIPVTLALTWLLRRRYGAGRTAVGLLRRDAPLLTGVAAVGAALPTALVPGDGPMITAFVVLGVGGAVAVLRGWGPVSAGMVVAIGGSATVVDASVAEVFAVAATSVALVAVLAVWSAPATQRRAGPWRRALPAGVVGALVGVLVASSSSAAAGATTWLVGAALAPSILASLLGGLHLARFWVVVPEALEATSISTPDGRSPTARVALRLVGGAAVVACATLVVLSFTVDAVADAAGATGALPLLVAFGAAALVALLVTLLEAFARPWWAAASASAACATYAVATVATDLGAGTVAELVLVAALAVAVIPLADLLRRPELTLATLA